LLVQVWAVFAETPESGFTGGAIWRGCDIVDIINIQTVWSILTLSVLTTERSAVKTTGMGAPTLSGVSAFAQFAESGFTGGACGAFPVFGIVYIIINSRLFHSVLIVARNITRPGYTHLIQCVQHSRIIGTHPFQGCQISTQTFKRRRREGEASLVGDSKGGFPLWRLCIQRPENSGGSLHLSSL
jgi:hypothetical protein